GARHRLAPGTAGGNARSAACHAAVAGAAGRRGAPAQGLPHRGHRQRGPAHGCLALYRPLPGRACAVAGRGRAGPGRTAQPARDHRQPSQLAQAPAGSAAGAGPGYIAAGLRPGPQRRGGGDAMSRPSHPAPRATMRLQLHAGFTLDDATAQVGYFARLGISHLYLSPVGAAVPGSTHGYDNTDPTRVNPELGGEPALLRLSQAARGRGMGLLLDIVPNHMATHASNAWWMDLLGHGRRSRHADWFDVDWEAPGAGGRLLLPVLDRPLHAALVEGLLMLERRDDGWQVRHYVQAWPLGPGTVPAPAGARAGAWLQRVNAGARRGEGTLAGILERQAYRLLWWRAGNDRVNYR